jgi:diguanylate cyclase (GGDEF)-like protein
LLSVIALEAISYWIKGPGSLAFSLPALIWCALSYRIFSLTLITATLCLSSIIFISLGTLEFTPAHFLETLSFRMGLCMLVLGPLAVAGSHMARNELMQKLSHAVNHDFLTDMLARGAFMKQGQRILERCRQDGQPFAILMLDLDHFKQINDSFGHAGGDQLLRSFSQTLTQVLRAQDIVGRMGGEEFAVALPKVDATAAQEIAKRINRAIRELRVPMDDKTMSATVSIGLVHTAGCKRIKAWTCCCSRQTRLCMRPRPPGAIASVHSFAERDTPLRPDQPVARPTVIRARRPGCGRCRHRRIGRGSILPAAVPQL